MSDTSRNTPQSRTVPNDIASKYRLASTGREVLHALRTHPEKVHPEVLRLTPSFREYLETCDHDEIFEAATQAVTRADSLNKRNVESSRHFTNILRFADFAGHLFEHIHDYRQAIGAHHISLICLRTPRLKRLLYLRMRHIRDLILQHYTRMPRWIIPAFLWNQATVYFDDGNSEHARLLYEIDYNESFHDSTDRIIGLNSLDFQRNIRDRRLKYEKGKSDPERGIRELLDYVDQAVERDDRHAEGNGLFKALCLHLRHTGRNARRLSLQFLEEYLPRMASATPRTLPKIDSAQAMLLHLEGDTKRAKNFADRALKGMRVCRQGPPLILSGQEKYFRPWLLLDSPGYYSPVGEWTTSTSPGMSPEDLYRDLLPLVGPPSTTQVSQRDTGQTGPANTYSIYTNVDLQTGQLLARATILPFAEGISEAKHVFLFLIDERELHNAIWFRQPEELNDDQIESQKLTLRWRIGRGLGVFLKAAGVGGESVKYSSLYSHTWKRPFSHTPSKRHSVEGLVRDIRNRFRKAAKGMLIIENAKDSRYPINNRIPFGVIYSSSDGSMYLPDELEQG